MLRNICTLIAAAGVLLVGGPSLAASQSLQSYADSTHALRPGDVIEVRESSGKRVTGRVAELTSCSVIVTTNDARIEIPASRTMTVKRLRRAEHVGANRIADSGRTCENPACMAVTLAFAGTTAVTRGVQKLFYRSESIYRAPTALPGADGIPICEPRNRPGSAARPSVPEATRSAAALRGGT
jgi:hypothetical protein